MSKNNLETLASRLVKSNYVKLGLDNIKSRENQLNGLLEHRKLPELGLDDQLITYFINTLSAMDSNNFHSNCGVGEREGRIYSNLVRNRHFNLSHGIGRSGDIAEVQPKACGSSLIYALANDLVHDVVSIAGYITTILHLILCRNYNEPFLFCEGINSMKKSLIVPMATGEYI